MIWAPFGALFSFVLVDDKSREVLSLCGSLALTARNPPVVQKHPTAYTSPAPRYRGRDSGASQGNVAPGIMQAIEHFVVFDDQQRLIMRMHDQASRMP